MKIFCEYQFSNYSILQVRALVGSYNNYVYLIVQNGKAWVFDPAEYKPIQETLEKNNIKLEAILITHHHPDHIGAVEELVTKWNCPVYGHSLDEHRLPPLTYSFNVGDTIKIGSMKAEVQFYPGHTTGLIAYYFKENNLLFSNDLIFSLGCGRVFEGTPEQMYESLNQLCQLPDETLLMISHEYTKANLNFCLSLFPEDDALLSIKEDIENKIIAQTPTVPTTLGFEKKYNPFIRWNDLDIRQTLNMEDSKDWQVFAEIRARKDIF